ncbi:hypothetical protein IHE45_04G115200 [Dioscorea alata]|uniref:Uncharacterized protein n=1 Tax=Dioscorea alata TaxID=55571 RepID=A0ACB7WFG3_DIOAL|nr:hypothetical protein IHE45_04G115200 [Dioscorea alata]
MSTQIIFFFLIAHTPKKKCASLPMFETNYTSTYKHYQIFQFK